MNTSAQTNSVVSDASTEWTIILPCDGDEVKIIWRGSLNSWPAPNVLSDIIDPLVDPAILEDIAAQIVKKAPPKGIPGMLLCLSCNYWRSEDVRTTQGRPMIDARKLQIMADAASRSVCGYIFKMGDLVWTCRQCAKDPTCVLCDKCFKRSNHEGHEVYFHRSQGGNTGCCDCGDPEAWSREGNCIDHNHISRDGNETAESDPTIGMPEVLKRGLHAVLRGVLNVIASYMVCSARGFATPSTTSPTGEMHGGWDNLGVVSETFERTSNLVMVGRLHNDDVHTYDEVTRALKQLEFTPEKAAELTQQVDKSGEAEVAQERPCDRELPKLKAAYSILCGDFGLLYSIVPQQVVSLGPKVAAAFKWMETLGEMSDGLRRTIVEALLQELKGSTHCFESAMNREDEHINQRYSPDAFFFDSYAYPATIPQLLSPTLKHIPLSKPVHIPEIALGGYPAIDDETDLADSFSEAEISNSENDFLQRLLHPFNYCHKDYLGIMLMSTPYATNQVKQCVNDIIIKFQHDLLFKAGFSQQFTLLYPSLNQLYCRHVGTQEDSVFQTSVQVYTANSVITSMSSDGVLSKMRKLSEGIKPGLITCLLSASIQSVLIDVGCRSRTTQGPLYGDDADSYDRFNTKFLEHHTIRTHRLSHVCRDLEYLSADPGFCTRLLAGETDSAYLILWLDVCNMLQCLDGYKRKMDRHVEREDEHWQDAANLVLEMESVTTNTVSRALLDQMPLTERAADSSIIQSEADAAYKAPIESPFNPDQLAALRNRVVLRCSRAVKKSIAEWFERQPVEPYSVRSSCLGHDIIYYSAPGTIDGYISVHIPLQRMLAKVICFAANGDVDLKTVLREQLIADEDFSPAGFQFMLHPMRCLLFQAQVNSDMWKRNGYTAANLAYNYGRPPLSKTLRDMDYISMHLSILSLTPDCFLATLIHHFDCVDFLQTYKDEFREGEYSVRYRNAEYFGVLLAELLKLLITLVTHPPYSIVACSSSDGGKSRQCEGWRNALKRKILYQILLGVNTVNVIGQRIRMMVGSYRTVSDNMLQAAIDDACTRNINEDSGTSSLSLRTTTYDYFDPEYPNLPPQELSKVCDRMRDHLKNHVLPSLSSGSYVPLIHPRALQIPHTEFNFVRSILYRPIFFTMLQRSLDAALHYPKRFHSGKSSVVSRVIHLVTLQIRCCCGEASFYTEEASEGELFGNDFVRPTLDEYFQLCYSETSDSYGDDHPVEIGCGWDLLVSLAEVWNAELVADDILYHHGLGWVLSQIAERNPRCSEFLASKGISFGTAKVDEGGTTASGSDPVQSKAERQKAAQQKALLEAQQRAAAAFAAFGADMSDSEDEDDDDILATNQNASMEAPEGLKMGEDSVEMMNISEEFDSIPDCIICKEKKASPLCFLCFLQPSNMMKNIFSAHPVRSDCPSLHYVFRVVSDGQCSIFSAPNEKSQVVRLLSQGEHVHTQNRDGLWLRVLYPVQGWCPQYGYYKPEQQDGMGVKKKKRNGDLHINLHPVSELQYGKHGGSRMYVSHCGHVMHQECWDHYFTTSFDAYVNGNRAPDQIAVDVGSGETICPLCKSPANVLLPYTPKNGMQTAFKVRSGSSLDAESIDEISSIHECKSRLMLNDPPIISTTSNSFRNVDQKIMAATLAFALDDSILRLDHLFHDQCTFRSFIPANNRHLSFKDLDSVVRKQISSVRDTLRTWSALAYTLSSTVYVNIRLARRNDATILNAADKIVSISDHMRNMLRHLVTLVRRSALVESAPFDALAFPEELKEGKSFDDICRWKYLKTMEWYQSHILDAFSFMLFGDENTSGDATDEHRFSISSSYSVSAASTECQTGVDIANDDGEDGNEAFLKVSTCSLSKIQCCLDSMPFEMVNTLTSPNVLLVEELIEKAVNRGVKTNSVCSTLRSPLVTQDMHLIAVGAIACAANDSAFLRLLQIVCYAKLAQILIEPISTGVISDVMFSKDYSFTQRGGSSSAVEVTISGPNKRAKVSADEKDSSTPSDLLESIDVVMRMRHLLCSTAEIPFDNLRWPQLEALLDIALDSWIPFLHYAVKLNEIVEDVCGTRSKAQQSPDRFDPAIVFAGIKSDPFHVHTEAKLNHTNSLLELLNMSSLKDALSPLLEQLLLVWASQFKDFNARRTKAVGRIEMLDSMPRWLPDEVHACSIAQIPHSVSSGKISQSDNAKGNLSVQSPSQKRFESPLLSLKRSDSAGSQKIGIENQFDNIMAFLQGGDSNMPGEPATTPGQEPETPMSPASPGVVEAVTFDVQFDGGGMLPGDAPDMGGVAQLLNALQGINPETTDNNTLTEILNQMMQMQNVGAQQVDEPAGDDPAAQIDNAEAEEDDSGGEDVEDTGDDVVATQQQSVRPRVTRTVITKASNKWRLTGVYPSHPTIDQPNSKTKNILETWRTEDSQNIVLVGSRRADLIPRLANFQGSVTGSSFIFGYNGDMLRYGYSDLSHFGTGLRHLDNNILIELPHVYTDLYQQVKFPANYINPNPKKKKTGEGNITTEENVVEDPAVCLVCGRILNAGNKKFDTPGFANTDNPGECTMHASTCGAGVGIFFLVQHCTVILMRHGKAAYHPSFYVDSTGEITSQRGQNRPLFLSEKLYKKIEELYLQHAVCHEVARRRAGADSVIRNGWY